MVRRARAAPSAQAVEVAPHLSGLVERLFEPDEEADLGLTLALVAVHRGQVVAERYGRQPDTAFGPGSDVAADTTLISWSMAKSITDALVGMCVKDGLLALDERARISVWASDERSGITLDHLLQMRSGLRWVEDYVDGESSDVIAMLFGTGKDDHAAYAIGCPLRHVPGSTWEYSSGTTNVIARIVGDVLGDRAGSHERMDGLQRRLFNTLGMDAEPRFDAAGTFVGSSYVYASARDFARFGYLYLQIGRAHV